MRLFIASVAMLMAAPATAAVTLQTSGTELTGATGVSINSNQYDVQFVDGTCAGVFGTCNASSFTFTTQADALSAAQALLDQVFTGNFDSQPARTAGCESTTSCTVYIPYAMSGTNFLTAYAINYAPASGTDATAIATLSSTTTDTSTSSTTVFARFTPSSVGAVPEPATWAMMLVGFGGIGFQMRRRGSRNLPLSQLA